MATTTAVPAPAAAVGYDMQTFGPAVTLGSNWQKFNFFGVDPGSVGVTQNADGSVTIAGGGDNYGAQLSTASVGSTPHSFTGIAFGGGGYFQAVMSFTGPASFWANDIETMDGISTGAGPNQWPGQAAGYGDWIEADFAEFDATGVYGLGIHNWFGGVGSGNDTNTGPISGSPVAPLGADYTKPNTYGFLWVPATATTQGFAKYYFDGVQVGNTITWNQYNPSAGPAPSISNGTAFSVLDELHLALILGTGSSATPNTVYSVSVWQNSAASDISTLPIPGSTPQAVTTGTGPDTLVLKISEDAYANGDGSSDTAGDATFTVAIDGKQQGGTFIAGASHAAGADQTFTFDGYFGPGSHTVTVTFLNDAWGGTASTDRNLYVDGVTYGGSNTSQSAGLYSDGSQTFAISGGTTKPTVSPSGTTIKSSSAAPIIDQNGNAWSLVQSASNSLQIAVNGTVDAPTANVVLLETLNGAMVQENSSGNWYSETTPNDSWKQIANPNPATPPPATVVTGSGSDTVVLSISEDAYASGDGTSDANGDAAFTVSVDGRQLAGTFYATASHSAGASQNFTLKGDWAPGAHTVTVAFLNDAWAGTPSTDRNLYVNDVTYDGTDTKQSAALMSTGSQNFSVTDSTAIPPVVTGGGSDSLVVKASEDYYLANAQFTVSVDGKQLGGTFTATTLHASGNGQSFGFAGDFGSGQHTVSVNFLNDAWAGTPATDRNLYVNDIVYNGTDTKQSAALMSQGAKTFSISGGTTPSVSETGDHGSLQENLSQTGTYTVGGDTFVLGSSNAATVTLGTGASQIKFVGPSSVTLTGGAGQATVAADAGNNKFVAGAGNLDVTGGAGKDAYVFYTASGLLTLEDFSLVKGDTLTIDKSLQGSLHEASDGTGGTMLTFGANTGQGIDLHGVAALPSNNILWA